jgi:hypothetical protein
MNGNQNKILEVYILYIAGMFGRRNRKFYPYNGSNNSHKLTLILAKSEELNE